MSDVTLRVRPGFVHGAQDRYRAGDEFAVPDGEAALLLAAFGDKLEVVPFDKSDLFDVAVPAETPSAPVREPRLRRRKPEDM